MTTPASRSGARCETREGREGLWLGGFVVAALALRGWVWWLTQDTGLGGDERDYFARAVGLAQGGRLSAIGGRPPATELFFGALFAALGTSVEVARLGNVVVGSLCVIPVHAIGRAVGGVACARIAAGVAALYPSFVAFSVGLWSEPLYLLLACSGLACALSRLPSAPRALAAGLCFGASLLVREAGLAVPLVVAGWWAWAEVGAPARRWAGPGLMLAVTAAVVLPWSVHINPPGTPFALLSRTTWQNLYIGNAPPAERLGPGGEVERVAPRLHYYALGETRVESETAARSLALEAIAARLPAWPLEKLASELPAFFAPTSFTQQRLLASPQGAGRDWAYRLRAGVPDGRGLRTAAAVVIALAYAAVAVAGTVGLLVALPARGPALLVAFVVAQLAPCLIAFASSRFRLPSMAVFAVGAGLSWVHRGRLRERGLRRHVALAAAVLLGALIFWQAPLAWSARWG